MNEETLRQGLEALIPLLTTYGLQVIGALLILIAGRIAAKLIGKAVGRALDRGRVDPALQRFLIQLVSIAVTVFAVVAAMAKFGIQTTSFVAVLGAMGLAVGLALQGSLGNFAAGVLILLFKPFRLGDVVEAAGQLGTVKDIGLFVTTMYTPDNRKILVPNSMITGNVITNINANPTRRVDMTAGIGYGDDIDKARSILMAILADHPKVLEEPAPQVALHELADSSMNFVVRPWVKSEDYWEVKFEVTRQIKKRFDAEGISIPFPQRDVHLFQETAS